MNPWEFWKKGFDAWESRTAQWMETALKSPTVLEPAGALLSASMRTKALIDQAAAQWWGAMGLSTRRDQERLLHAVNQLNSKLLDLEERLQQGEK